MAEQTVSGHPASKLLSLFQWLVLRRAVRRAGWWIPAHGFARTMGMLVAFVGVSSIPADAPVVQDALVGAATGLAMGALVGALTGLALPWQLYQKRAIRYY